MTRCCFSGYDACRLALLIEDNTALGNEVARGSEQPRPHKNFKVIRFPKEISLLRNAQTADQEGKEPAQSGSAPSPYLHMSLKDFSTGDGVPQFSRENTPLSQEAQLMTIARQLHRYRSQFIGIIASSTLDQIFLAQFLHRSCPDARLLFFGGDLLMVREVDNVPFIGTVTVTPYGLIGLGQRSQPSGRNPAIRAYPNSDSGAYYNAASYTFWNIETDSTGYPAPRPPPRLMGYHGGDISRSFLWATAIGTDGYYPLAILNSCASDLRGILPAFDRKFDALPCQTLMNGKSTDLLNLRHTIIIYPSLVWVVLCIVVSLLCLLHGGILVVADYWSPFTRDVAIPDNDQPRRRSMYIHVGMTMLMSMAFVVAYPVIALSWVAGASRASLGAAVATLCCGVFAVITTFWKTNHRNWWAKAPIGPSQWPTVLQRVYHRMHGNIFFFINCLAWTTLVGLPIVWILLCSWQWVGGAHSYVGLMFSYRCVNPGSGVSPIVPVLLLLFSWYLWAFFQTWRLRFSENGRPWLPERIDDGSGGSRFFVADGDLDACEDPRSVCLYRNITCFFVTRQVIRRFHQVPRAIVDVALVIAYASLLTYFALFTPIRSLDHFLWDSSSSLPHTSFLSERSFSPPYCRADRLATNDLDLGEHLRGDFLSGWKISRLDLHSAV